MSKLMISWWGGHLKNVQSELMQDAAWGVFYGEQLNNIPNNSTASHKDEH